MKSFNKFFERFRKFESWSARNLTEAFIYAYDFFSYSMDRTAHMPVTFLSIVIS